MLKSAWVAVGGGRVGTFFGSGRLICGFFVGSFWHFVALLLGFGWVVWGVWVCFVVFLLIGVGFGVFGGL